MLFWHVGGTVAAIRYSFRDDRMDLRLLIVGAVLPDVIDTPLGMIGFSTFGGVRLLAHSLLFASVLMVAIVLTTRRGRPRKRWMPLAIGVLTHLVLDAMWTDAESLLWPFLGFDFAMSGAGGLGSYVRSVVTDWRVWSLEVVGAGYLAYLASRGNLWSSAQWDTFKKTGRIGVPIERG